jgi:hypothetical protein
MDVYTLLALAIAGTSGALFSWSVGKRKQALLRVKARSRRR